MARSASNSLSALLALLLLAACQPTAETRVARYEFESIETTVPSRGVEIPVTYVHPIAKNSESFPLVVMAHGHGGTRDEAGGYTSVAEGLAARGVAFLQLSAATFRRVSVCAW